MTKLSEDLKRMLAGLAFQDAAEFLPISEKMKVLNGGAKVSRAEPENKPMAIPGKVETTNVEPIAAANRVTAKHIAFISNGTGINAPLDYAIESCLRQHAQIDLLIHDCIDVGEVTKLEKKIHDAGVRFQRIQIDGRAVDNIVDYVTKQTSLIYIIATPVDTVAKALIEESSSRRNNHLHVPLVLINDDVITNTLKRTAA